MQVIESDRSKEIYRRLCEVIPGGVNSPVRNCLGLLNAPIIPEKGEGDLIYDVDGRSYIDYCGSWGALIHGHAHPMINEKVKERLEKGSTFGMTTEIEEKLARKVVEMIESMEMVRFVTSGTEATMSALRLARGYTGRQKIVKFIGNYHGHADFLLVKAGSGVAELPESSTAGVSPEMVKHTINLPYNDSEAVKEIFQNPSFSKEIAAVILEPVAGNMGVVPASQEFIDTLRKETERNGSLLIFDEVMTGFRVALNGAQSLYQIKPDLTCLGKIVGGGFPAAAFGGKKEIMEYLAPLGAVYQAGTLSGNPVAMEAGYQALTLLEEPGYFEALLEKTERLLRPIEEAIEKDSLPLTLHKAGAMFSLFFSKGPIRNFEDVQGSDTQKFTPFFQHLVQKGIYPPPSPFEAFFVSQAHTDEHLEYTSKLILEALVN